MKKHFLFVAVALAVLATSCSKDENEPEVPQSATAPSNFTPQPADADGVCVAIETITVTSTPVGEFATSFGVAVAVFPDTDGTTFREAGTVSVNEEGLSKQDNNSYVFIPGVSNATGIDFSSENSWSVAGNGTVSAFDYAHDNNIPNIGGLTAEGTVSTSSDFTFGVDYASSETDLTGAEAPDSIYFFVHGQNETLSASKAYTGTNSGMHTFTADQMSAINAGEGFLQVAAVRFDPVTLQSQKIYFINEGVSTQQVTFE